MTLPGWTRTLALWHQAANTRALLALPTITLGPYMSDDDVEFHSAMLELHTMLEDLHDLCIESGEKLRGWVNLTDAHRFGLDHPWPADEAEAMLQAWRAA